MLLKNFCQKLNDLHFNEINMIGAEQIPSDGPLIICCNHANQFVDASLIIANLKRQPMFIGAAKSFRRPVIGQMMRQCAIPVERAQDLKRKGKGTIIELDLQSRILTGKETDFSEIKVGDTLTMQTGQEMLVEKVIDESHIQIKDTVVEALEKECQFRVTPKIDYTQMYESVWQTLKEEKMICIFPEGGSHDRTDLLPLKAGVCIMALGAMAKYNLNVKIVTIGLNYYRADHFQSKAFIIAGKPFDVTQEMLSLYKSNKRDAIGQLLTQIENQMREVTITSPDYAHQKAIYSIRRMYTSDKTDVSVYQKITLNQRFSKAFQIMGDNEDVKSLIKHTIEYNHQLTRFNILDKNLEQYKSQSVVIDVIIFFYYIAIMIILLAILVPGEIFVGPMQLVLAYLGEKERSMALKSSSVKLQGRDVVASKKILLSIVFIPLFPFIYAFFFFLAANYYFLINTITTFKIIGTFFLCWPTILYLTYKFQYVLIAVIRKIRSRLYFIFSRNSFPRLIQYRRQIRREIQELVINYFNQVFDESERVIKQQQQQRRSSIHIEKAFNILSEIYENDY